MNPMRTFLIPPVLLATVLLGACGGDDDGVAVTDTTAADAPEPTGTETPAEGDAAADGGVTIERSRFGPEVLEVAAGTTVTFENTDPYAHTVTSADDSAADFDSGELAQDETFEQTFDEAGTYEYFCQIHPTMTAEVVVS